MGSIFYLSHQPGDSFSLPDIVNIDKFLHCMVYAVLGWALFFALAPEWRRRHPFSAGCAVVLFCLMYGITDEFHQFFIPGRCASGADLVADGVGGCLSAVVNGRWHQWRERKTR
jgi:VanZ family protein